MLWNSYVFEDWLAGWSWSFGINDGGPREQNSQPLRLLLLLGSYWQEKGLEHDMLTISRGWVLVDVLQVLENNAKL